MRQLSDLIQGKRAEQIGAILHQQLQEQKFTLHVNEKDPNQTLKLRRLPKRTESEGKVNRINSVLEGKVNRINSVLGRKILSIMREKEILEEMGAKEVTLLEGRLRDNEQKSDFVKYLEKINVADHAKVA